MRVGELMGTRWCDVDFERMTLNVVRSVWHQRVGPVKTEESEKVMPLSEELVANLGAWRAASAYASDSDWIFPSEKMNGKQPLWPEGPIELIRTAAKEAGITKHLTWHVFRHTFSTLLAQNGEDIKTVQSLMRHANSRITLEIYTHAVGEKKRAAQVRVEEMYRPRLLPSVTLPKVLKAVSG
jgi:integrase